MSQSITIDKANKENILQRSGYLKEELKMSLVSMAMNIGYFNINISVKKDEERKREMLRKNVEHDKRIKEALEKRNNILFDYQMQIF